ncbi:MAG: alpha/beta hydrolase [Burkholderiaceae bacterium]|nr:alpha/beta hydrolase [Burkholderiaceae bacterium]
MPALTAIVLGVVGAWTALAAGVYFGQERLLFLPGIPSREIQATPADVGLAFRELEIASGDGLRLHGWHVPAERARGTVLFMHGNAGNISHRLESIRIFNRLDLSVLIFDYRGYGRSEGKPSEAGILRDAQAAWRHLLVDIGEPAHRVVVFGRSMGGAPAASVAAEHAPAALIIESSFTSIPDLAAELYWWLPARRLARVRLDTRALLARVSAPVLVVHSADDEIIGYTHAQALYAAAGEPKQLLTLRGDHNSGFALSGQTYTGGLRAFIDRHLERPATVHR